MELTLRIHRRTRVRIALLASTTRKPALTRKTTAPRVGRASTTLMRDLTTPMTAASVGRASTSAPLVTPPSRTVRIAKLAHTAQVMDAVLALTALRASIRQKSVLRQRTRAHSVRKESTTRRTQTRWEHPMAIVQTAPSARTAATLAPKMTVPAQVATQESTALWKELPVSTAAQIAAQASIPRRSALRKQAPALTAAPARFLRRLVLTRPTLASTAPLAHIPRQSALRQPPPAPTVKPASILVRLVLTRPTLASTAPLAHILAMVLPPAAPARATP